MNKMKPIPIKDYICSNCTQLKAGKCELAEAKALGLEVYFSIDSVPNVCVK